MSLTTLDENDIVVSTCVSMDHDLDLLPHFIHYYRDMDVDKFLFLLHANDPVSGERNFNKAKQIILKEKIADISLAHSWIGPYHDIIRRIHEAHIIYTYADMNQWLVTPDIDEFFEFPISLHSCIKLLEAGGNNLIFGQMVDRVSSKGDLQEAEREGDLFKQFPHECTITKDVLKGKTTKICLRRAYIHPSPGNNEIAVALFHKSNPSYTLVKVNHFKWRKGAIEKHKYRLEHLRGSDCVSWQLSKNFLDAWHRHKRIPFDEFPFKGWSSFLSEGLLANEERIPLWQKLNH